MDDRTNTIAGWVLAGGVAALSLSIVSGMVFKSHAPEKAGYAVEGATTGPEEVTADQPIAALLATADPAKGADVFKKCAACHTINQGGASGIGPNLWGVVGKPHGHIAGFAFSDALKGVPGPWTFDALDAWLKNPRKYAPGTKMTFAGLPNQQDRANLIVYMNTQGSNLPLPAAPAAAPAAAGNETDAAPGGDLSNEATPAAGAPSVDKAAAVQAEKKGH